MATVIIAPMLLALDIGNTNVTLGLFRAGTLVATRRAATRPDATADEFEATLEALLRLDDASLADVSAIAAASVVPALTAAATTVAERRERPILLASTGTMPMAVRVDQRISVKTSRPGETFTGEIVEPIMASDGNLLVPKGTRVKGVVDASHRRGRFKGASLLELRLTAMTLNGSEYPVRTRDLTERKKGKGKRTAGFIGGGSGLGMLIGGLASGGTGLVIGGLAGGGKASLLGIEIWRDDINARGGLLGRKVELVVYDDKSSASETPAI